MNILKERKQNMDEWNMSVGEAMELTHKSREFIINAIQQGVMPGSVVKGENGRRTVHIPRKAFISYMTEWNMSPTDEVIEALFKKYTNK